MLYILNLCLKAYGFMWPDAVAKGDKYRIFYVDMHNKNMINLLKGLFPGDF